MQNFFYNFNPNSSGTRRSSNPEGSNLITFFLSIFVYKFFVSGFNEDELLLLNEY